MGATGGGCDANVFNGHGLQVANLGTGIPPEGRPRPVGGRLPPRDLQYAIALPGDDLRIGGRYRLTIEQGGRTEEILVKVPPGLRAGTRLRLRGKGELGRDGTPGDLYLHVRLRG